MAEPAPAPAAAAASPAAPAAEAPAADNFDVDSEIQQMERELSDMDKAAAEISEFDHQAEQGEATDAMEVDKRSVYVGNVDYGATPEELEEHFKSCGVINRITIMVDKFTCCPKGFAYMEFSDPSGVLNAELLHDSLFRGRQLKVLPKRSNIPGWQKGAGGKKGKGKGKYGGGFGKGKGKNPWYAPPWKGKGKGKFGAPY